MLWRLHTVNHCQWLYTVLHWTQCVKLYCKMVSFSRSVWKKLHRAEKIYMGCARNNYEVWVYPLSIVCIYFDCCRSASSPTISSWRPPPRGWRLPSWKDSQGADCFSVSTLISLLSERKWGGSWKCRHGEFEKSYSAPFLQVPRLLHHINWPPEARCNRESKIKSVF